MYIRASAMDTPLPRRGQPSSYSLKEDLARAVKLILIIFWLTTPIWIMILRFLPPRFSVQVVGTTATGLDDAPETASTTVSTVFNLTLHADNRRAMGRCYSNGEVAVRYSGHTVAWGRTMAFCVGAREARDVPLVAWADGVGLPRPLRDRMAADWRRGTAAAAAVVEFEVDVKLFRADDGSARPAWVSCKVTAAGGAKPPLPPIFTPCTVFALQNWASDISPAWTNWIMNYL